MSGVTSGLQCVHLGNSTSITYPPAANLDGQQHTLNGWGSNITMAHGDSGGPTGNGGVFLGVFSGGSASGPSLLTNAVFSRADEIGPVQGFKPDIS